MNLRANLFPYTIINFILYSFVLYLFYKIGLHCRCDYLLKIQRMKRKNLPQRKNDAWNEKQCNEKVCNIILDNWTFPEFLNIRDNKVSNKNEENEKKRRKIKTCTYTMQTERMCAAKCTLRVKVLYISTGLNARMQRKERISSETYKLNIGFMWGGQL